MNKQRHRLADWQHSHDFIAHNHKGERGAQWVLVLTVLMMVVEISAGSLYHSMALIADGWHMSTHALAFLITLFAYRYARIHRYDMTFAFSPAKVGLLGAFASSIALGLVAILMLVQSVERFIQPQSIRFDEAIMVAFAGLLVNIVSAFLLHDHSHDVHSHDDHHHHDHNLKAAYLHVMADLLTSVLAISALAIGKLYAIEWLDPLMGVVGGLVILLWSKNLIHETSPLLLDHSASPDQCLEITAALEEDGQTAVVDLHVWQVGAGKFALVAALISQFPQSPEYYKKRLQTFGYLKHITVEVNRCDAEFAQLAEQP